MQAKIDINSADVETLMQLPGIGESLARRIITYRETVHPFEEVIELTAVPGISERMVRQFEDQVTVETLVTGTLPMTSPIPTRNISLANEPEQNEVAEEEKPAAGDEETADLRPSPPADPTATTPASDTEPAMAVPAPRAFDQASPAAPINMQSDLPDPTIFSGPEEPAESTASSSTPPPAAAPPATTSPDGDTVSRRRGCIFVVIGALLGAVLGAALTLAILSAINNGSLRFVQADNQLRLQIDDTNRQLETLNAQLQSANEQLDAAATRVGALSGDQRVMGEALDDVETAVATAESHITALEETAVELDERLNTVADSAETFDTFLNGMRDLLVTLQGPPPTATPTPTPAPTETAVTTTPDDESGTETATPTAAATQPPTRTPRPTATSIVPPTPTPAQQP